jgi:hypothetical protein
MRARITFPRRVISEDGPLVFFIRCVGVVGRSQISFVCSLVVLLGRGSAFDRSHNFIVGVAGNVVGRVDVFGRRAGSFGRAVHEIAGCDYLFQRSHHLSGRCVIFFGRHGERFRRRDPDFRRRAHFFGTRAYSFGADALSIASRTFGGHRRPKTLRKEEKEID